MFKNLNSSILRSKFDYYQKEIRRKIFFFLKERNVIVISIFIFMNLMQVCFILFMKNNEEYNLDQNLFFWNFLLLFDTNHLHFMTTDLFQLNLIGD